MIVGIVVVSLVVAISLTPMLTATVLARHRPHAGRTSRFERLLARATDGYGHALQVVLGHRGWVLGAFGLVLLLAAALAGRLGSEFLPQMDDGRVMIKAKLPTGAALAETDGVLRKIEQRIAGDSLVASRFTLAGGRVWGLYTYEVANEGEINIQLVPRDERGLSTGQFIEHLRPVVAGVPMPGGKAMVSQMKVKGIRKLGDADLEVKIKGPDVAILHDLARQTLSAMNSLEHFTNVSISMDMTKPEYQVRIDRERAADLGVSVRDVAETLRALITGTVVSRYRAGDRYYSIRLVVPASDLSSRQDIEQLPLRGAHGNYVRIGDVARVTSGGGPVEIIREDQVKQVIVQGDVSGVSVGPALRELQRALGERTWPPGYEIVYGGQAQMMGEMTRTLLLVLAFAVFFAFVVLAVQFNSLRLPALILGSMPVSLAGMVFILLLTGLPLGATVAIGVLVVIAATVNDGVLLLTFARELQTTRGLAPAAAVVDAAKIRLRPRVMTTICTVVGFLPLALAIEQGGDMLRPMAVGAVGGLLMEVLVALFLMPCGYAIFADRAAARRV